VDSVANRVVGQRGTLLGVVTVVVVCCHRVSHGNKTQFMGLNLHILAQRV
jgi:hypothetical protein